jgi:transposase
MARSYRPVVRDQPFLLPPDMREWLPADHLVWFVLEIVDRLDRSAFHARHPNAGVGRAAYDPDMLLGLLIYAYCNGVRSSRQIERLCWSDVAFRVLCAQDVPDHATIARFRASCQEAFAGLFVQVLLVAGKAGLARFGTVAIDGTKIAANASVQANRDRDWLAAQVTAMLAEADQADAAEDARHEHDGRSGGGMPPGLADPTRRSARIAAAAAEVQAQTEARARASSERARSAADRMRRAQAGEPVVGRIPRGPHRLAEARAHLAREITRQQAKLDRRAAVIAAGKRPMGPAPVPVDKHPYVVRARRAVDAALAAHKGATAPPPAAARPAKPAPKIVANTSDPQSRLMPTRRGFVQGYNAQVAVTADQMIAAVTISQSPNDMACLVPMMRAAQDAAARLHAVTGSPDHTVGTVLADAGYASDANLAAAGPERLIALGKGRDQAKAARAHPATGSPPPSAPASPRELMRHRLRTPEGSELYKRRGATVEPGIGNLKKIIDRFSRRGLDAATSELHLAAAAFNLLKIHRAALI